MFTDELERLASKKQSLLLRIQELEETASVLPAVKSCLGRDNGGISAHRQASTVEAELAAKERNRRRLEELRAELVLVDERIEALHEFVLDVCRKKLYGFTPVAAIPFLRHADRLSWPKIAKAMDMPQCRCRKLYEELLDAIEATEGQGVGVV